MNFKDHLKKYLDEKEIESLVESFSKKEHKGFYLNKNKLSNEQIEKMFPFVKKHPVVPNGYLFDQDEYKLGSLVYHELGAYYIQDPSAMLVAYFLDPKPGQKILDLCAAPGGKTTMTSIIMEGKGQIIANDISKSRANILLQNVERMGLKNVVVTSLDFSKIYKDYLEFFDAIILDAPCSGSGMFRKKEEMKSDWTYEKVLKNSKLQKELLLIAYSMLKKGGTLMYSTCSYSYEEDEENVAYLISKTDAKLEYLPDFDGVYRSKEIKETIHLFPTHFYGEGHYIAKIKKPGESTIQKDELNEVIHKGNSKGQSAQLNTFILNKKLPKSLVDLSLRPGLFKETKIGNKIIPSHHYSHVLDSTNSIELNKEELICYLKGESIRKNNLIDGYYFVSYLSMNIGVVHVVNGELKNLYPKGLRKAFNIDHSF